ncbi:hypothetical protein D9613_008584 [Agrocybe pediades]|uniref:Uncharacterized protein n=1 Tax=Agrocybe pediades TaxID=84607 RepID=A0A8H4VQR5_9AGAR|nr:hypothetical protein D9613_008584 [Agrocybe pediades]
MQLYLIARLFVQGQDDGSILPDNYFAVAFQSFDIGIFVSRLNLILQCKTMDARHLRAEIVAITPFIHDRSYRTHIVESRVHVELVASVKRILIKSAKQKTNKRFQAQEDDAHEADAETGMSDAIISSLLHCCGHFLWKLLELSRDGDGGDLLLDLIRNTAMMEICAAAMQLLNRRSCMAAIETPWHCILIMVGYLLHPSHRSRFPLLDSVPHFFYHGLAQAVKTVIERIAMPVLVSLTSEGGDQCSDVSHSDYSGSLGPRRRQRRVGARELHRAEEMLQHQMSIPQIRNLSTRYAEEVDMRGMSFCFLLRQRVPDNGLAVSQGGVQEDENR